MTEKPDRAFASHRATAAEPVVSPPRGGIANAEGGASWLK